jgi:FkbM family methyltransferase
MPEEMERSLSARARSLPRRFLDACARLQCQATGLVSVHGHHVFAPGLDDTAVVIDAGAHTGEFSRQLADRFGCRCYALEPVPALLEQIPEGPLLRRFPLALGGADGEALLHLSGNPQAHSLYELIAREHGSRGNLVARLSTLESFLREAGLDGADLLKLDIEGAEVAVLATASDEVLGRIGQITVEIHDFLEGFAAGRSIAGLKRRLRQAGFTCVVMSRPSGHHGDTLFINRRRHSLRAAERLNLFLLSRVTLELRRLLHHVRAWMP